MRVLRIALTATALLGLTAAQTAPRSAAPATSRANASSWLTFGHDAQRSGFNPDEHHFSPSMAGGIHLLWQSQLPASPLALAGLTAALLVHTPQGARVIVAGSSDQLFALDAATGHIVWQRQFSLATSTRPQGMWLCPNNLNDTPVIDAARQRVFVISSDGRLHTLALADGHDLQPALRILPPYAKMWSLNYSNGRLYTTLSQDCNDVRSGIVGVDPDQPGHPVTTFSTTQNCGHGWCGAGVWGRGGVSAGFDGFLFATAGDAPYNAAAGEFGDTLLKLTPALSLADHYTPANWHEITAKDLDVGNSTPVIFRWHHRVLTAVGGKQGVIYLNDTARPGGADHHQALFISPRYSNDREDFERNGIWGGMSAWTDRTGRTWLYVPTWGPPSAQAGQHFPRTWGPTPDGSIMAFQVVAGGAGQPTLQPAWRSLDLAVPEPVAIAGGLVFALSNGENTTQTVNDDVHRAIADRGVLQKGHAVLYALDARTGKTLWSSGQTIQDWVHFGGLAIGNGTVIVTTHSGYVYAFQ